MIRARFAFLAGGALLVLLVRAVGGEGIQTPRTDFYGDPLPPGAVARLGTLRLRHLGADVAFSKDGKHFISCGSGGEVRVWDADSGKLQRRQRLAFTPKEGEFVVFTVLAPGGATAAVVTRSPDRMPGRPYLYDTRTGKELGRLSDCGSTFAFSPDGAMLAGETFEEDRIAIQLWKIADGRIRRLRKFTSPHPLARLVFAPNGKLLAGINQNYEFSDEHDDEIHLWDITTGDELSKNDRGATCGMSVAFSPDSKTLAVGSRHKGRVRLLDTTTFKEKAVLKAPAKIKADALRQLVYSPDGQLLAAAYDGETNTLLPEWGVLLWDTAGKKETRRLPEDYDASLLFAPDGKTLACFGRSSEIRLWDVQSGRQRHPRPGHPFLMGWLSHPMLAGSLDGKLVASCANEGLYLWDASTGKPLFQKGEIGIADHPCLFSPDGKHLLGVNSQGALQTWDVPSGKTLRTFETGRSAQPVAPGYTASFSADGKRVAAVVSPKPSQLFVWDAATGKVLSKRPYKATIRVALDLALDTVPAAGQIAFAPDGATVSVLREEGPRPRLFLEDVSTGALLARLPKDVGQPVVFSPRGRLLAAPYFQASKKTHYDPPILDEPKGLSLIEVASGEEVLRLPIGAFGYLDFTADGRGVITADGDGLRVWDADTGERLHQMPWPKDVSAVRCLAALPGGRAATGMEEGEILIWDLVPASWARRKPVRDRDRKELEALWTDLASDARRAHRAVAMLAAVPAQALPFLETHLPPAALDTQHIEKLLADLDGDDFAAREAASRALSRLRYRVQPMLQRALEAKPALEKRRRLQAILADPSAPSGEDLRRWRAIAVLERIGSPEARRTLEKLAGGTVGREARAAQAALQRLERRDAARKEKASP